MNTYKLMLIVSLLSVGVIQANVSRKNIHIVEQKTSKPTLSKKSVKIDWTKRKNLKLLAYLAAIKITCILFAEFCWYGYSWDNHAY